MAHARDDVINWLEEKIRTNTETEEEYELYIDCGKLHNRIFKCEKYQELMERLYGEAREIGQGQDGYL